MRRLIHIVMVVALLLSGPLLPASMMPCCVDDAMPAKVAVPAPAASSEGSMDMADCNHEAAVDGHAMVTAQSSPDMDCMGSFCAFRSSTQTAAYDVSEQHEGAVLHTSMGIVIAVPPVVTNAALSNPPSRPPSPLTATLLPLRV